MAHARPFWTFTLQDLSNGIENTSLQGVLTPTIKLWIFGSQGGLQVPTFGSVSFILTLTSKWGCDMRSTTSYACEFWLDSKKIEAIEVVYWRFFKSLLRVRKITSTSIMLAKFGKFPFEHFAWRQVLLYCNHVSTVSKDHILGKAWEAQLAMLDAGKKCWVGSMKKWLL
jgi:hypothetical protein